MLTTLIPSSQIRAQFSRALSDMYRAEVPKYGALVDLVSDVNANVLASLDSDPSGIAMPDGRIEVERHGAIRVGTPTELGMIRRLFAVMGMFPVGYYDLAAAGVPVHSTAFRPLDAAGLAENPFRVFTSLPRLDLIKDAHLRDAAASVLNRRSIFTPGCVSDAGRYANAHLRSIHRIPATQCATRNHRRQELRLRFIARLGG